MVLKEDWIEKSYQKTANKKKQDSRIFNCFKLFKIDKSYQNTANKKNKTAVLLTA